MPATCSLSGGILDDEFSKAYCKIGAFNRADIYLVDTTLDLMVQYTLTVNGVTNPYIKDLNSNPNY